MHAHVHNLGRQVHIVPSQCRRCTMHQQQTTRNTPFESCCRVSRRGQAEGARRVDSQLNFDSRRSQKANGDSLTSVACILTMKLGSLCTDCGAVLRHLVMISWCEAFMQRKVITLITIYLDKLPKPQRLISLPNFVSSHRSLTRLLSFARFSPENKANLNADAHQAFGLGPRKCVAEKFTMLYTKLVLSRVITEFRISVDEERHKVGTVIRVQCPPLENKWQERNGNTEHTNLTFSFHTLQKAEYPIHLQLPYKKCNSDQSPCGCVAAQFA